jgi:hypothetical protein
MSQSERVATGKFLNAIPRDLDEQVNAIGSRIKSSGKEKTIYLGELIDSAGKSSEVKVITQLPQMVRLEGIKGQGSVLAFDGDKAKNASDKIDDALLETFALDIPEAMLASIQKYPAIRLLGRRFGPNPRITRSYSGPRYDIFAVTVPTVTKDKSALQSKLYYFDSATYLLHRTEYTKIIGSASVKVETRFDMWGTIEGAAFPARIERYEDGKRVFSFIATEIESGPAEDITNYR